MSPLAYDEYDNYLPHDFLHELPLERHPERLHILRPRMPLSQYLTELLR